jgi:hypothetical protein
MFFEDITRTALYKGFHEQFVGMLRDLTTEYQKAMIGTVLQVAGYGKTHIAKVYTPFNNAIVLNFSRAFSAGIIYQSVLDLIAKVKKQFNGTDPQSCHQFSTYSLRGILILLYAAVEHYGIFYTLLANNNNQKLAHEDLQYMCARLFDNGCLTNFVKRVEEYWDKYLYDDKWFKQFVAYVQQIQAVVEVGAMFCDEVHGMKKLHVGEFLHTNPPDDKPGWGLELMAQRAKFEVVCLNHPEKSGGPEWDNVRDAYKRHTSVTYQIIAALEHISRDLKIAIVTLTTDYSAIDFTSENNDASRNRMTLKEFEFNRDPSKENDRFLDLITEYFGFDLRAYLKKSVNNYEQITESWGRRPLYFSFLLNAVSCWASASNNVG